MSEPTRPAQQVFAGSAVTVARRDAPGQGDGPPDDAEPIVSPVSDEFRRPVRSISTYVIETLTGDPP